MNNKALILFSGGLDSRLATRIVLEQKIRVELCFFRLPFGEGCSSSESCVLNFSQLNNLKLHIIDLTCGEYFNNYISLIRSPQHGRGSGLNPCRDCRIFMFKIAREKMLEIGASFIVTGEVLGQRPMSQLSHMIFFIEKKALLEGRILRPLSAKLLPQTEMEKLGIINREKLFAISGRSRKVQLELAKSYGIKFPNPAGGCLLCDKKFSEKLLVFFDKIKELTPLHIKLLTKGRHFKNNGVIVVGRSKEENDFIEEISSKLGYSCIRQTKNGPAILFTSPLDSDLARELFNAYSSKDLTLREKYSTLKL